MSRLARPRVDAARRAARHSPRPTDVQGIEADAFDIAAVVAHVRLTDNDRAALAPVVQAAPRPALRVNPRAIELRQPASVDVQEALWDRSVKVARREVRA